MDTPGLAVLTRAPVSSGGLPAVLTRTPALVGAGGLEVAGLGVQGQ